MAQDKRADYLYTHLFCEENIWQLVRALVAEGVDVEKLQVLFISNENRQVLLYKQKNALDHETVLWDYHVVLRQKGNGEDIIYDFDTCLPFPSDTLGYLSATFGFHTTIEPSLRSLLRLIPAASYLKNFYSNRRHMQGQIPESAFPPWETITPSHSEVVCIDEYWDVSRRLKDGSRVISIDEFMHQEL